MDITLCLTAVSLVSAYTNLIYNLPWKINQWCQVEFIWTPGHEGVGGNELADEEAKAAAKGDSSEVKDLPPFLRRKLLPISIFATRKSLEKDLKSR